MEFCGIHLREISRWKKTCGSIRRLFFHSNLHAMNHQEVSKLNDRSYEADMKIICEKFNDIIIDVGSLLSKKVGKYNYRRKTFKLFCCNNPNRHPENLICKILLQIDASGTPWILTYLHKCSIVKCNFLSSFCASYYQKTRSIPWLLLPWSLACPGHRHPFYS